MRSSPLLFAVVLGLAGSVAGFLGACSSNETSTTTTSSTTSQASVGATTGDPTSGSTSGGGMGSTSVSSGSMSSASSTTGGGTGGGSGGYTTCSECTSGAPAKECKAQYDACMKDAGCTSIYNCTYFDNGGCSTNKDGACCTLKCFTSSMAAQASIDLYKAYDNCVTCTTCKMLCSDPAGDPVNATEYCATIAMNGQGCP